MRLSPTAHFCWFTPRKGDNGQRKMTYPCLQDVHHSSCACNSAPCGKKFVRLIEGSACRLAFAEISRYLLTMYGSLRAADCSAHCLHSVYRSYLEDVSNILRAKEIPHQIIVGTLDDVAGIMRSAQKLGIQVVTGFTP